MSSKSILRSMEELADDARHTAHEAKVILERIRKTAEQLSEENSPRHTILFGIDAAIDLLDKLEDR